MNDLTSQAINEALKGNWKKAIEINLAILNDTDEDIDALNRLSRAYFESGHTKKAIEIVNKVLKLDSVNPIAKKSLEKYKRAKVNVISSERNNNISASDFIEEPGKTKVVTLLNLGKENIISCLDSGDEVIMAPYTHRVSITTLDGQYIGRLPDDLSAKLRVFCKGGNKYKVLIKTVDGLNVKVFIRELVKGEKYKNTPTFIAEPKKNQGTSPV